MLKAKRKPVGNQSAIEMKKEILKMSKEERERKKANDAL